MSPAALRKRQPGVKPGQGEMASVTTPAGGHDELLPVAAPEGPRFAGPRSVADRAGFGLVAPVKDGGASLASHTVRDIEFAAVARLKEKGFDWGRCSGGVSSRQGPSRPALEDPERRRSRGMGRTGTGTRRKPP
jgi:hypothetical protein